jgi:predicted LPLAT superfamily acyltransferase
MVSLLAIIVVDREFEQWSGQTKDYEIGIWYFFLKHMALRSQSKDWLAQNRNNVSEWSNMSTHELLFQRASTIKIQLSI